MGKFVFSNPYFAVERGAGTTAHVNFSSYIRSLSVNFSRAEVDATCMTDEGMTRLVGLWDWTFDVELAQDFADNTMDEYLWDMVNTTKTSLRVKFKPTTSNASATNPYYRGQGLILEYTPASGSASDLGVTTFSVKAAAATSAVSNSWLQRLSTTA